MTDKAPSLAGRAFLALVLMIGFYLLALAICGTLVVLCWIDAVEGRRVHPKLWIFAAITVGVVLWSVFPRRLRLPDPGVPLLPKQAPRLWSIVEDLARRAGQQPPAKVYLVPEINAFVGQRNSWLGLGGERIMGVGLPLLQVLTVPQLQAVIAHEFGHFHGGDTRLGPFLYKVREAIGRTIVNLAKTDSMMHKPFEWYGKMFLRVTHSLSRAQEFAADALSVRLVGREPARAALCRSGEVGPLFDHYLQEEYLPMLNRGRRAPLVEGFALYLASEKARQAQIEMGEAAMQARGNPYDTHPPLSQRLAAVDAVADSGSMPANGPMAITLLDGVAALEPPLLAFLCGDEGVRKLPTASWAESGQTYAQEWSALAAELAPKLAPHTVAELAGLADQLEPFAAAYNAKIPAAERLHAGGWCLGFLLGDALMRAGFTIETGPGDPIRAVRGGDSLVPMRIAQALANGELPADAWAETCRKHGIGGLRLTGPEMSAN